MKSVSCIYKIWDWSKFRQNATLCAMSWYLALLLRSSDPNLALFTTRGKRNRQRNVISPPPFMYSFIFENRKFLFVSLCRPLCMTIFVNFLWNVVPKIVLKFIYSEKATKFCEIFTLLLTVCTAVKSKVKISQNFVAFSEYMNFN